MFEEQPNYAKHVYWYILSLITLIVASTSMGTVIFQLINKYFPLVGAPYSVRYDLSLLRFAVSSLFIAGPIYLFSARQINRSLAKRELALRSNVRRWLTYFILLIAS